MSKILIVEDEFHINDLIAKNLTLVGHSCLSAYDGIEAVKAINKETPDLIILDVMIPGISGFELMKMTNGVPVIFVTAKTALEDKLKGLSLGAEDYIVKPFEMLELIARVNVVLRRNNKINSNTLSIGSVNVDLEGRKAYSNGVEVDLTPKEFSLLEVLIINRNIALSREKILELVWEYDYEGGTRTVDVHIQLLRQKLGLKDKIKTVYKVGYVSFFVIFAVFSFLISLIPIISLNPQLNHIKNAVRRMIEKKNVSCVSITENIMHGTARSAVHT